MPKPSTPEPRSTPEPWNDSFVVFSDDENDFDAPDVEVLSWSDSWCDLPIVEKRITRTDIRTPSNVCERLRQAILRLFRTRTAR